MHDDTDKRVVFRPLIIPYVIATAWIGFGYMLGDPQRTLTPSFDQARQITDISTWGWLFLIGALCLALTMWIPDSLYLRMSLFVGGVIHSWWGFLFFINIFNSHHSSLNAPICYWFLAYSFFIAAALTRRPDMT